MFRRGGFLPLTLLVMLGLALLAGCETTGPAGRSSAAAPPKVETLPVPEAPVLKPALDGTSTNPAPPSVPAPTAPTVTAPALVQHEPEAATPGPLWIDWQTWRTEHPTHRVELVPGSRRALWEGTPLYLGFEPRLLEHRVEVLRRDIDKNFAPLLDPQPVIPALRRIVIDPGHGGTNSGTRSITGNQFEKQLTLDWALRLAVLLRARGWEVALTRTNDASLDLPGRVEVADRAEAALFVSLHFNGAFPNAEVHGLETYCLTPKGLPSTVTRDFADDASQEWPNNAFDAQNLRLAMRIHRSLIHKTGAMDRGVRRARFMGVLRGQRRPAVLIEGGFLSNPAEAAQINTPAYRQRLAEAVVAALEEPQHAARSPDSTSF